MLPQPVQSMLPRGFNQCSPSIQCFSSTHSESPRPQRSPVDRPLPHPPPQWPSSTAFRSSQSMLPHLANQRSSSSLGTIPASPRFQRPPTDRHLAALGLGGHHPSSWTGSNQCSPSPPINAPPPRQSNAPRPVQSSHASPPASVVSPAPKTTRAPSLAAFSRRRPSSTELDGVQINAPHRANQCSFHSFMAHRRCA